ncbi:MAG: deacylase [Alphaproteobacteria bacterium]|jgi:lipid A 3-O-deacylase|nr:deacylase [Alphaproteobacteria bacterium]
MHFLNFIRTLTMKQMFKHLLLLAGLFYFSISPNNKAMAQEDSYISFGSGWYDLNDNRDAVDLRLEYRSNKQYLGFFKPWIGFEITSDIAAYGALGLLSDLHIGQNLFLTPSLGVGVYSDGDGKKLGNTIQFRSQIEIGYKFADRSKLSLALGHISNAHLSDENPGTEIITVYYSVPVQNLDKF